MVVFYWNFFLRSWGFLGDFGILKAEKEKNDLIEAQSRQTFDSESKCFDMRNLRATDVKLNTFVVLPEPQSVKYEAGLELRRDQYLAVFREYVKQNCDSNLQQESNLTHQQRKGMKKLCKRVANGEIIISSFLKLTANLPIFISKIISIVSGYHHAILVGVSKLFIRS